MMATGAIKKTSTSKKSSVKRRDDSRRKRAVDSRRKQVDDSRREKADGIADKYIKISAGAGLVPIPVWDVAAVFGAHLAMVKELAEAYGVSFSEARAKHLVSALIGSVGAPLLGFGVVGSLIKAIPVIGTAGGLLTVPALAAASAYATSKVFIQHFESGGDFTSFDPTVVEAFYMEKFNEGKEAAKGAVKNASTSVKGAVKRGGK